MEDYPMNLAELESRFGDEDACRAYLAQLRWPDGFVCPRCGCTETWTTKRCLIVCSGCQYQASVTAGTIFEGTRKPLAMWFRAIWWVCAEKNGASALGLQQILGLGSYRTAWTWLHKLRRAMVRPGRDRLSGRVEVDEAFLGATEEGHTGRQHGNKALIVVAAQEDGRGIGRIRMKPIDRASQANLHGFITEAVTPGATVITDGLKVYRNMDRLGYAHEYHVIMNSKQTASELLPRVHRVVSLLKRWLLGTHQGAVSHEHLGYYLDEFTFRFNRRTSRSRGKLFYRLLQQAVAIEPVPYQAMVQHARGKKSENNNM
jgi:transposase-like protein